MHIYAPRSPLNTLRAGILAVALLLGSTGISLAQPVVLPPGIQYRLAFVTSSLRDATSTNIEDYNAFVTSAAANEPELLALGTTWKAIASTASVDARDNTDTNPATTGVPIYLLDGSKLADNNADLWDGTIDVLFNVEEDGATTGFLASWTGASSSGEKAPTFELGTFTPFLGRTNSLVLTWIQDTFLGNSTLLPLYAMSGIIEAPPAADAAGAAVYHEDFDGETFFFTFPEVDILGIDGLSPFVIGSGPPPAPTFSGTAVSFSLVAGPSTPPDQEVVFVSATAINPALSQDIGVSATFDNLAVGGTVLTAVGVQVNTPNSIVVASLNTTSTSTVLSLIEVVGGIPGTPVESGPLALPTGLFEIELLLDRDAETAVAWFLPAAGPGSILGPLALTSAGTEGVTSFSAIASVGNFAGPGTDSIDVDLDEITMYYTALTPVPALGGWGLGMAIGAVSLGGMLWRRRGV